MILLFSLFYYGGSEFSAVLVQGAQSGDFTFLDENAHPIIAFLLSLSVIHWIIITLIGVFGSLGIILLSLIIAMIVVGFLTPVVIKIVRERHYMHIQPAKPESFFATSSALGFVLLKFLALFVLCLPFLLLPFVSFFILNIPFFYLFYKFLLLDILANGVSEDAKTIVDTHKNWLILVMLGFYTLSLFPFFGLFFGLFFVIYLSHFILSRSH